MSFLANLFTPSEDYNYKIIFLSYLVLSIMMVVIYVISLYWEDVRGFWIVVRWLYRIFHS